MKKLIRLIDYLALRLALHLALGIVLSPISSMAGAPDLQSELTEMTREFDAAQFAMAPGETQMRALLAADRQAEKLLKQFPDRAESLCWRAWTLMARSAVTQEFAAIEMREQALLMLQAAVALDESVFAGEAYVSLGELNVSGAAYPFPIRYGLKEKGRQYFLKALEMNPTGLRPNLGYAHFLFDYEQDYSAALKYANAATNAPPLQGRNAADKVMRAEATNLVAAANARLK